MNRIALIVAVLAMVAGLAQASICIEIDRISDTYGRIRVVGTGTYDEPRPDWRCWDAGHPPRASLATWTLVGR